MNRERDPISLPGWVLTVGALGVIAAGIVMRLVGLGMHPYGLYQDEAINGLDALRVLGGEFSLYFPANNGREPLFIYTIAATVGLLGRTTLGLRAAAAIFGLLALPATYLLGRAWANQRVGLLSTAILAGMLWHLHLSRVGFRAVALPLLSALALGLGAYALRRRSRWAAVGAGAAYGLSFYTYLAARITPLALLLMLAYALLWHRPWLRERWRLLLWSGAAALLILLPLLILAVDQPNVVLGRSEQVAIWSTAIHQGDFPSTATRSILRTVGMFTWRGDGIWRHNVPGRPVFDPLMGLFFIVGLGFGLARWRKRPALALSLIWVAVMVLPTMLAEDAPHFLRAVGILPVVVLIPALALDWVIERAGGIAALGVLIALVLSAALAARDYFGCRNTFPVRLSGFDYVGCYRNDPIAGYFFQAAATDLAHEANAAGGTLYLDRRFLDTFPSLRFLLLREAGMLVYNEGQALSPSSPPLTLIAWPHTDLSPTLGLLPSQAEIGVWPGPETRGDLEKETYRLYVRWTAYSLPGGETYPLPLARFENGLTLVDAQVSRLDGTLSVILRWQAAGEVDEPVQMFLHLLAQDGTLIAQFDGPPGTLYYPPLSWEPGSVIIHPVSLALAGSEQASGRLQVGLYHLDSGERVPVLETTLPVHDDALLLP